MIWITGYVGSGKSTISKNLKNVHEFDEIESLITNTGIKLTNIDKKTFTRICKVYLNNTDIKIFNGVQACDYYKKGDKVYFVKTNFLTSTMRSIKRDRKNKVLSNIIDNIKLFFKLKILYIKAYKNKDIIKDINELKATVK